MKLYRVYCGWDDVDGVPVFWAGTKRDAQRIRSHIIRENKPGGCYEGAILGDPDIEEVNVPTDKKGLLAFLQSNAQIECYPTYPSDVAEVVK
tara:strand:+ start:364 stop:639 length:276 start_codon:yes stop_codon:yes gene_type:complete